MLWAESLSSVSTLLPDNDSSVVSVINDAELLVITTFTSQPSFLSLLVISAALYAAILPVIPNNIFLFIKIFICSIVAK